MSVAVSDSAFYLNVLLYLAIFDETRKVFRPSNCLDVFLKLARFVECRISCEFLLRNFLFFAHATMFEQNYVFTVCSLF